MQEGFLESVFSAPCHTVAGVRLLPFSLAHWTALDVSKNPFIHGGKPGAVDAIEFMAICSTPPAELFAGRMNNLWWFRWKLCWLKVDWSAIAAGITNYIRDYGSGPEFWAPSGKGKSLRSPWVLRVVYILCSKFGMRATEAWATPFGLALWYEAVCGEVEQSSSCEIMTEEEESIAEMLKNMEEKRR